MYAVIRTGGKQYRVAPEDVIRVERLAAEPGSTVELADVLMIGGDAETGAAAQVGTPLIDGARVTAEVVEQTRGEKIVIFKKKRRKNFRRKNGHRQDLTVLRITDILAAGEAPGKKAAGRTNKAEEPAPESAPEAEAAAPEAPAATEE